MIDPGRSGRWVLVAVLLAAFAAMLAGAAIMEAAVPTRVPETLTSGSASAHPRSRPATTATSRPATTVPDVEALIPLSVDALVDEVSRSVGFVLSQQGTGSGVVISEDLLVTNAHVTWPDRTVSVVFRNGATHQGRVLALDPFVDLALVDISGLAQKPPPIAIGSSEGLEVGEELFVIGYPIPEDLSPDPTIDSGEILAFTDWDFTGIEWFTIGAPAIAGQSGGAVVDEYGRIVGISTFGSLATLTSMTIDDVLGVVDRLLAEPDVRGLDPRWIPHSGARRSNTVTLDGPWDQQLLFGWFLSDAAVTVEWAEGKADLAVFSVAGEVLEQGPQRVDFEPGFVFPVVVAAEADTATESSLESSLPLISYDDPDHGQVLPREGMTSGIYEVGGDRDFFYLDLTRGEVVSVTVESAARTKLVVYGPDGEMIAGDFDFSGFTGDDASVRFTADSSGRYVISARSSLVTVSGYTVVTG